MPKRPPNGEELVPALHRSATRQLAIGVLTALSACGADRAIQPGNRPASIVRMEPDSQTVGVEDTVQVHLMVQPTGAPISWSIGDTSVIRLSAAGIMVARDVGTTTATATAAGASASMQVVVVRRPLPEVLLVAHRGYAGVYPENTLVAFKGAVALGADALETDMQFTSDSVPVIMHDETVDRTTNGHGAVRSLTFAQVRELDACSKFGAQWGPCAVPTPHEVLQIMRASNRRGLLEFKDTWPDAMIRRIITDIDTMGVRRLVTLTSFEVDNLERAHRIDPGVSLGLYSTTLVDVRPLLALGTVSAMFNDVSMVAAPQAVASLERQLASAGGAIGAWTFENTRRAAQLRALGAGWLISDVPLNRDSVPATGLP